MKTLPLKSLSWNFPTASADLFPMTHILLQFLLQRVGKKTFESDVCTNQTGLKTTFEQDKLLKFLFVEITAVELILPLFTPDSICCAIA